MLDLESDTRVDRTRNQASSRSKLRDSCHACAISKVKCPKEKPSCSKCECRGITCQYFLARRPGRRRENNSRNTTGNRTNRCLSSKSLGISSTSNSNPNNKTNSDIGPPMEWDASGDTLLTSGRSLLSKGGTIIPTNSYGVADSYLMTPISLSVPASPRQDNVFAANTAHFVVPGEAHIFSAFAESGSEVNDMDFMMLAMDSPFDLLGIECGSITGSINQTPNDIESLLMPAEKINTNHGSLDTPSSLDLLAISSGASSTASNVHSMSVGISSMTDITDISQCGCLMQALDLLKKLSSGSNSPRMTFSSPGDTEVARTVNAGSAQIVILENKQSMEVVSSKLACSSCVDDSFLLAVLSMIVLKILERYAIVAQGQPHETSKNESESDKSGRLSANSTSNSDDWMRFPSYALGKSYDDGGTGRMAAQLVLSELHRVQRLVNQLSPKLKGPKEREGQNIAPKPRYWGRLGVVGDGNRTALTSVIAGTLDQMEKDVRKSLNTLSKEIINSLRQG